MERFALFLLGEERLLGTVSSQMLAVTMCCFKFIEFSGIVFGIGEQLSEVKRTL